MMCFRILLDNPNYNGASPLLSAYGTLYGDPGMPTYGAHQIIDCSTPTSSRGTNMSAAVQGHHITDCSTPTNSRRANMSGAVEVHQIIDCSTPTSSRDTNMSAAVEDHQITKVQKPSPHIFPVPEMPWTIEGKTSLTNRDRRIVFEYMFHDEQMYPTSHHYIEATQALLEKYPELALNCPVKSPMVSNS